MGSAIIGGNGVLGSALARARLDGAGPPIRRPGLLVAALLAASLLAACGRGSPPPTFQGASPAPVTSPAPTSRITPGHGTPQDAVEGYVRAEFRGNWLLACSYASPDTRQACLQGNADLGRESGRVVIYDAEINGDYALVELRGTVCNKVVGCVSNYYVDPSSGMPTRRSGFRAAYHDALQSGDHRIPLIVSPLPMIKVNGQWYVNYG